MRRTKLLLTLIGLLVVSIGALLVFNPEIFFHRPTITVYHAGSLTVPFEEYKTLFEHESGVNVRLYAGGSRKLAMEIIDLGKRPDVYASADYALIRDLLIPNFTSWYIIFATNEMVLAYTPQSKYANEINSTNWFSILNRSDVSWGHSDPDLDPCGYRALLVIKLAEVYYGVPGIYEDLNSSPNRIIRPKSVDLLGLLETGELDYAFEYKSVAIQHNLSYVELPKEINLGDWSLADYYAQVNITLSDGSVVVGAPIAYGLTIIDEAPNYEWGVKFVKFVLEHLDIMEKHGQNPVYPAITNDINAIPQELRGLVREG